MGIILTIASSITLMFAGLCYSYVFKKEATISPNFVAFFRIILSFIPPLILFFKTKSFSTLFGIERRFLFLWGISGSITVTTYFISSKAIGIGMTQFLSSIQSVIIIIGSPFVLNIKFKWSSLIGVIFSVVGLLVILLPEMIDNLNFATTVGKISKNSFDFNLILIGLVSGIFSGVAYLFMAKARISNRFEVITLYWAIPSFFAQLIFFGGTKIFSQIKIYDYSTNIWFLIFLGGILTLLSQIFLSEAYRYGKVIFATFFYFIGSLINVTFEIYQGQIILTHALKFGILLILFGSVFIPLFFHFYNQKFRFHTKVV